jgi:hypothetical protein
LLTLPTAGSGGLAFSRNGEQLAIASVREVRIYGVIKE